jgi:transcriptional regulator with XRE-family HTH domain
MAKSIHSPEYRLLCARLQRARLSAGLTQTDVGARLQRPQSFVAKYEVGERRIDPIELIRICHVLGVSPGSLIQELSRAVRDSASGPRVGK